MGPQGLDGGEYQIPRASTSHGWIMLFFLLSLILTLLDIITHQLSENADCNASLVSVKIYNYAHLTSFQGQMEVISLV